MEWSLTQNRVIRKLTSQKFCFPYILGPTNFGVKKYVREKNVSKQAGAELGQAQVKLDDIVVIVVEVIVKVMVEVEVQLLFWVGWWVGGRIKQD